MGNLTESKRDFPGFTSRQQSNPDSRGESFSWDLSLEWGLERQRKEGAVTRGFSMSQPTPPSKPSQPWGEVGLQKHAQLLLTLRRSVSSVPLLSPHGPLNTGTSVACKQHLGQWALGMHHHAGPQLPDTWLCPGQPISTVRAEKALRSFVIPLPSLYTEKKKDGHRVGKQFG